MHVCWGNYPGPHHHDVPLRDIIETVLTAAPKYLSIEACTQGSHSGHPPVRGLTQRLTPCAGAHTAPRGRLLRGQSPLGKCSTLLTAASALCACVCVRAECAVQACNPGHGHEWEVFQHVELPADKVLMPGVLDTTTSHIEHPRLVAQRLMNYVRLVGAERVMACTDCGFSTAAGAVNVPTEIVYAKLESMVKGAALADEMAAAEAKANSSPQLSGGGNILLASPSLKKRKVDV